MPSTNDRSTKLLVEERVNKINRVIHREGDAASGNIDMNGDGDHMIQDGNAAGNIRRADDKSRINDQDGHKFVFNIHHDSNVRLAHQAGALGLGLIIHHDDDDDGRIDFDNNGNGRKSKHDIDGGGNIDQANDDTGYAIHQNRESMEAETAKDQKRGDKRMFQKEDKEFVTQLEEDRRKEEEQHLTAIAKDILAKK